MENFATFMSLTCGCISNFLLQDPIIYFVGLTILAFIVKILGSFVRGFLH